MNSSVYRFRCVHAQSLSNVWHFVNLWTRACQAPLLIRFSRQESWSELPFPTSGDLPNPGIELTSLVSPALARLTPPGTPLFIYLWPHHVAHRILVPQPGIEPMPPALEVQSSNHWITRGVPRITNLLNTSITLLKGLDD